MISMLREAGAWVAYRLIRAYWWIRRPVVLGVRVLVADEDRVLLVNHSYREGWFLPGGTPEVGESLVETARREVREETGVMVDNVTLLGIYSSLEGPESDHVAVFAGKSQDRGSDSKGSSPARFGRDSEVAEVRWVSMAQLPQETGDQAQWILRDWQQERSSTYRVVAKAKNLGTETP